MSTRCYICEMTGTEDNPAFRGIYCHHDGYPEGVGKTLALYYGSKDRVDALMALGDLSSLGPEIGERHDFDSLDNVYGRQSRWCLAYGRDRGEGNCGAKEVSLADLDGDPCIEYVYVFRPGDGWGFFAHGGLKDGDAKGLKAFLAEKGAI